MIWHFHGSELCPKIIIWFAINGIFYAIINTIIVLKGANFRQEV